jgi:hypothetical protein
VSVTNVTLSSDNTSSQSDYSACFCATLAVSAAMTTPTFQALKFAVSAFMEGLLSVAPLCPQLR